MELNPRVVEKFNQGVFVVGEGRSTISNCDICNETERLEVAIQTGTLLSPIVFDLCPMCLKLRKFKFHIRKCQDDAHLIPDDLKGIADDAIQKVYTYLEDFEKVHETELCLLAMKRNINGEFEATQIICTKFEGMNKFVNLMQDLSARMCKEQLSVVLAEHKKNINWG